MKRMLATVVLVCVLVLTGCSNLESTASSTPANPILNKTISAMNQMLSYCLNTDLTENFTIVEKSNSPSTETWEWKSQRQVDVSDLAMHYSMDCQGIPDDVSSFIFERYLIGGWIYFNSSSPLLYSSAGVIQPWTKYNLSNQDYLWAYYSQLSPQIELLQSAKNIDSVGTEQISGGNYEIIQFVPSAAAAADWILSQEQGNGPSVEWWKTGVERSKEIYTKALKNCSVKIWVDQDDYSLLKEDISLSFNVIPGNVVLSDTGELMRSGQANSTDVGFQHILVTFNGEWDFSGYNQPLQIQLPQAAQIAQDESN
jgi:hypothetical protein